MDELLELWEAISELFGPEVLAELVEAVPDLSDLAEALDIVDLDPEALGEMIEVGDFLPDHVSSDLSEIVLTDLDLSFDALSGNAEDLGELLAGLSSDVATEPVTVFVEGTDLSDAASHASWIAEEVAQYPAEVVEGLDVSFLDSAQEGILGEYLPDDEAILIHGDHADELKTLHHEIGHHAIMTHPQLKQDLLDALLREGFDVRGLQPAFLELYAPEGPGTQIEELCAQAVSFFKSNAGSFTRHYPGSAAVLREWLEP